MEAGRPGNSLVCMSVSNKNFWTNDHRVTNAFILGLPEMERTGLDHRGGVDERRDGRRSKECRPFAFLEVRS